MVKRTPRRQPSRATSVATTATLNTPMSLLSSRHTSNKSSPATSVDLNNGSDGSPSVVKRKASRSDTRGSDASRISKKIKTFKQEVYVELSNDRSRSVSLQTSSAKAFGQKTDDEDNASILTGDSLNYNENESSDPSGSDFEADSETSEQDSEEDEDEANITVTKSIARKTKTVVHKAFVSSLSEDEADDIRDAILRSKLEQTDEDDPFAAGSSRSPKKELVSLSDFEGMSALSSMDDESDVPLTKGKGKGKGEGKATKAVKKGKGKEPLTAYALDIKAEEKALRMKLGRKLTWAEKSTIALYKHHGELKNVWGDVQAAIPVVVPVKGVQPAGLKCELLPFQLESITWMKRQEESVWRGGILADEMGMGKTIQTIALLLGDRQKPNLIVAPTVAIMQWRNEIASFTDGFEVLVWHGTKREQDIKELNKYDVVLTTYAVLESAFRKQQSGFKRQGQIVRQKSAMHAVNWHRVILDEAHNIKERATNTAKAAFELKSEFKWCLSGTPLQNRVGELYSVVRFLGGDPFSYYFCKKCDCKDLHWSFKDKRSCDKCGHSPMQHTCFWNNEILTPIQKHGMAGPGHTAFKKLKILLDRMMLRRTKVERADDLGLPPRIVKVRRDYFSPEENELYLSLFSDAKRQFSTYVDSGTVLNNYSNIFSLITRMRQMACHPDLVLKSKRNAETWAAQDDAEATVCRICSDIAEDAIQSSCRHIFDRECIKQYLNTAVEQTPDCPVCHVPLSIDLEAPAIEINQNIKTSRQGILGRLDIDSWRSSSKIEALVEELSNLRRQDSTTKSLVFSQFVNFLDLIAFRLQRAGFKICRLEGTMSPQARDATIKHFMNTVDVTVFLVSLKAGGVALNLTAASRVYLMDSWWNPAVEYQAMDRIHRLGQHRPVEAIKLVIEDSIESRIVQLQEKKSAMVEATLSADDSAMGRLTPQDLGFLFRL